MVDRRGVLAVRAEEGVDAAPHPLVRLRGRVAEQVEERDDEVLAVLKLFGRQLARLEAARDLLDLLVRVETVRVLALHGRVSFRAPCRAQ